MRTAERAATPDVLGAEIKQQLPPRTIFAIIGPEGSGKSSLAKDLQEKYNQPLISLGNLVRSRAESDLPLSDRAREVLENKTYLEPHESLSILSDRLRDEDTKDGFILDGAFRSKGEVDGFNEMLRSVLREHLALHVVSLRVPGWVSYERLVTGENARQRKDDTIEGVHSRLTAYHGRRNDQGYLTETLGERLGLLNKISKRFIRVNTFGKTKDDVFEEIDKALTTREVSCEDMK